MPEKWQQTRSYYLYIENIFQSSIQAGFKSYIRVEKCLSSSASVCL